MKEAVRIRGRNSISWPFSFLPSTVDRVPHRLPHKIPKSIPSGSTSHYTLLTSSVKTTLLPTSQNESSSSIVPNNYKMYMQCTNAMMMGDYMVQWWRARSILALRTVLLDIAMDEFFVEGLTSFLL